MKVAAYMSGIPPKNKNKEKPMIITNFIEGVNKVGDQGIIVNNYDIEDADVAVIQGFVHNNSKNVPHLMLRRRVIDTQANLNRRTIIVDSNLFLYKDLTNSNGYLRYSYDGIFPNTGEYCNRDPNPKRWDILSKKLGITVKEWNTNGQHILICCQRDGGWSMQGERLMPWLFKIISQVKHYSDRKILVRFHPGDKQSSLHEKILHYKKIPNVFISKKRSLIQDLTNAHCTINFNSSPAVASAIEGVPIIVLDSERSPAKDVANTSIEQIENLKTFDRELWVQKLAQCHWTLDELKTGKAWEHMKQWAKK